MGTAPSRLGMFIENGQVQICIKYSTLVQQNLDLKRNGQSAASSLTNSSVRGSERSIGKAGRLIQRVSSGVAALVRISVMHIVLLLSFFCTESAGAQVHA